MPRSGSPYGYGYEKQRRLLLAVHPLCQHCGQAPSTQADHKPALGLHRHVEGSGCCVLIASCRRCNNGGHVVRARKRMRRNGQDLPPITWVAPRPRTRRRRVVVSPWA